MALALLAIYSLSIPIYIIPLAFFCYYPLRIQRQWKVRKFGREPKKIEFLLKKRFFFWCWKNYTDKAMCPSSPRSLWFQRPYFLSPLFWSLSLDGDYHDVQTTKSMALLKVAKPRNIFSTSWKTNKITVYQLLLSGQFRNSCCKSGKTRLLYHVWFPKLHTHISALTVLALLKNTNKRKETTNEKRYPFQSSMFSYVTVKVNVVTCEYIDFYLTA